MSRLPLQLQGIIWMITTGFLAVTINTLARYLSTEFGYHPFQIVFFYSLLGLLFYMPALMKKHIAIRTSRMKLYWLRSVFEFGGFSLAFLAVTILPLPMHTALSFTTPLFGSVAAIIFLREESSLHRWLALAMGFSGVLIVAQPGSGEMNSAALLMLGAAMCFAICGISIKKLTHTEPGRRIAFYMLALTAVIALPFAIAVWQMPVFAHIPYLLALGALVAMVQFTVSLAFSKAEVTIILPCFFLNLIWSSIYAYFLFDEMIDNATIIGAAVIIGATMYNAYNARRVGMIAATEKAAMGN
jgi:drug/metabolite transporter (DMT)-like permease